MKVLVAGANGAIGMPLTRALIANGHTVVGLSRTAGNADRLRALGAEPLIADALDREALLDAAAGLRLDAVIIELTALKKMPMRHADMALTDILRERGTANLIALARATGAHRAVTQSYYGGYGYLHKSTDVITEETPFAPHGAGAFERHLEAMRSAERQTLATDGIEGIALRYGGFYGPGAGTQEMVAMLRRRSLPTPRGGGGIATWVYIEDAAAATVAALERGRAGEVYNIADDQPVTWGRFLGEMAAIFGAPRPFEVPSWLFRAMPYAYATLMSNLPLSNAKAKRELGWAPSAPTIHEGLQRTVEALRQAQSAGAPSLAVKGR